MLYFNENRSSFAEVVFRRGRLSPRSSFAEVVFRRGRLSPRSSFAEVVFRRGRLSPRSRADRRLQNSDSRYL